MNQPAEIVLSEVDVERVVLGSLFMAPEAMSLIGEAIDPVWFSDPFGRYLFEAALKTQTGGSHISHQALIACMPEDCGGISRNSYYSRVLASAMPVTGLPGLVRTMKDRWARRELVAMADGIKAAAVRFEADPYEIASDAVLSLDTINAINGEKRGSSLDAAMQELDASLDAPQGLRGATTGLLALDKKLNGYKAGQLYVVAGRPGMGKSAFMCTSLRKTAQAGHGVAIFSLEMTGAELASRFISDSLDHVAAPMFGSIAKGQLSETDRGDVKMAMTSLEGLPLYVDDSPRLTMSEIAARARQQKAAMEARGIKLAVVCIDHMGLVTPSDRYRGNKVAEGGEVSNGARTLAKELDCCVLLLCQLSREVEKRDDKRPTLSDLRWSGEIEQDAHVVAFLYREAYYLAQNPDADPAIVHGAKHLLEFLIRKNRNGSADDVRLWCSIAHSSIRDEL